MDIFKSTRSLAWARLKPQTILYMRKTPPCALTCVSRYQFWDSNISSLMLFSRQDQDPRRRNPQDVSRRLRNMLDGLPRLNTYDPDQRQVRRGHVQYPQHHLHPEHAERAVCPDGYYSSFESAPSRTQPLPDHDSSHLGWSVYASRTARREHRDRGDSLGQGVNVPAIIVEAGGFGATNQDRDHYVYEDGLNHQTSPDRGGWSGGNQQKGTPSRRQPRDDTGDLANSQTEHGHWEYH